MVIDFSWPIIWRYIVDFANLFIVLEVYILIFWIALLNIIWTKNLLRIIICLELMLLPITMIFIIGSLLWIDVAGLLAVFGLLSLSAAESAIGLGLLVSDFNQNTNLTTANFQKLKG